MKAKEYLQQYQRLDAMVNQKIKELGNLYTMSVGTGGIDYSNERVQTSPSGDAPFVTAVNRKIDLEEEIHQEIDRCVIKKHEIINQIQLLGNPKHIEVLYKRYIEFKSLGAIAFEMKYTYQYVIELHGNALREFQKTFKNL